MGNYAKITGIITSMRHLKLNLSGISQIYMKLERNWMQKSGDLFKLPSIKPTRDAVGKVR